MESGISLLRITENQCQLDKHYILYQNANGFETELGRMTYKYKYVTLKMQFEVDKLEAKIADLERKLYTKAP